MRALRSLRPDARFVGFGGRALCAEGVELLEPLAENPVMGFARVLPAIGRFVRLLNGADRFFAATPPSLVVPVDYPGFNVRLARLAKRRGIPTAYYICPQYWAWAPWRVGRFARSVDLGLTILPFEAGFLARHGVRALHVGHPLADRLVSARAADDDADALALLPGSRRLEIEHLLGWQLRAAQRLAAATGRPIRCVSTHPRQEARDAIAAAARAAGVKLEVSDRPLPQLLRECRAALVASGTATLECALLRVPSVIVYHVNRFMLRASRFVLTSPFIGLPNLLAGRELFPEHLAVDVDEERLAADLASLWNDGDTREGCLRGLDELRRRVLVPGAAEKAAAAIVELLR